MLPSPLLGSPNHLTEVWIVILGRQRYSGTNGLWLLRKRAQPGQSEPAWYTFAAHERLRKVQEDLDGVIVIDQQGVFAVDVRVDRFVGTPVRVSDVQVHQPEHVRRQPVHSLHAVQNTRFASFLAREQVVAAHEQHCQGCHAVQAQEGLYQAEALADTVVLPALAVHARRGHPSVEKDAGQARDGLPLEEQRRAFYEGGEHNQHRFDIALVVVVHSLHSSNHRQ